MNDVLTPAISTAIVAVFAVLAASSVVVLVLPRVRPTIDVSDARERIGAWWLFSALFALAIVSPRGVSMTLLALVSYLALKEYFTLIPTRRVDRSLLFVTYVANPVQYIWVGMEWFPMFMMFIPVYMFVLLPLHMVLTGDPDGFVRRAGTIHWGLMTTVFALSHAAYLLVLPDGPGARAEGAGLLVFLLVLTELSRVGQYWWGRLIRVKRIAPRVVPGKSVGGLIGATMTTTIAAMLMAPYLTPFHTTGAFFAGIIITVAGFLGDVAISALKRDLRIRETGGYIPGHGGVLDRVDSLTLSAPAFFHFVRFFFYS